MRVSLSTYGSRGDVEPMVGLAVALRALGAGVRVCAPPDFADLLARVGVPLVPAGRSVREMVRQVFTGRTPPSASDLAGGVMAAQFGAVAAAAEGCDVIVAAGLIPAAAGARAVSRETWPPLRVRGLRPVLPAVAVPPAAGAARPPVPPDVTDNRVLWDLNAQDMNAVFGAAINAHRASVGLPPVDSVRDHVFTGQPWLAADPTLAPWPGAGRISTWCRPARGSSRTSARSRPGWRRSWTPGTPPVYAGFGSMPLRESEEVARAVIEAIRAQGRRILLGSGWADLALLDNAGRLPRCRRGQPAGTVPPGGRRRAPRRRGHDHDGRPGRRASGGRAAGGGPALLGQPGSRPGYRRGPRRSGRRPPSSLSAALKIALAPETVPARPPWPGRSAPTGRSWPRSFCST